MTIARYIVNMALIETISVSDKNEYTYEENVEIMNS